MCGLQSSQHPTRARRPSTGTVTGFQLRPSLGEPEPAPPPPGQPAAVCPPADSSTLGMADDEGAWACELCDGPDAHGPVCPYRLVLEKMGRMEALMDERMRFLDERLAAA